MLNEPPTQLIMNMEKRPYDIQDRLDVLSARVVNYVDRMPTTFSERYDSTAAQWRISCIAIRRGHRCRIH